MSKLPDEILSKVFIYCNAEFVTLPFPRYRWPGWYQIGRVCYHWRHVLWSSPYLLNDIEYTTRMCLDKAARGRLRHFIDKLFARSSGFLSVSISLHFAEGIIDIIRHYNHRIRRLVLCRAESLELPTLFEPSTGLFSCLEELSVNGSAVAESRKYGSPHISSLDTAPNLHKLSITEGTRSHPLFGPPSFLLPFHQLTHLNIVDHMLPDLIHDILRQCTSLVHLRILIGVKPSTEPERSTVAIPLVLPKLETLNVSARTLRGRNEFLQSLVCPMLTTLKTQHSAFGSHDSPISLQACTAFITRSACSHSLKHLRASGPPSSYHDILEIGPLFRVLPTLISFGTSSIVPPELFRLIQDGVLPDLEKLCGIVRPDGLHAFLDLIETLAMPDGHQLRLQTLQVSCLGGPGLEEARQRYLEAYQAYGHLPSPQWSVSF